MKAPTLSVIVDQKLYANFASQSQNQNRLGLEAGYSDLCDAAIPPGLYLCSRHSRQLTSSPSPLPPPHKKIKLAFAAPGINNLPLQILSPQGEWESCNNQWRVSSYSRVVYFSFED